MNHYGAVYPNGVMSPPPSKQASVQSQSPNGNGVFAFPQTRTSSVTSPRQNQLAIFHDGYQVGSPQPMPQSPYPTPTTRSTMIEDPEYQEYLEQKRRKMLAAQLEQQQVQQNFQQQQEAQQWAQQQQWQLQQREQQQQSQQQSPQTSPRPYPLPAHLQRPSGSSTISMDDTDQRYAQQFAQQYQQQFAPPQPYVHAIRPGHTYGKITARGKTKILMGNAMSGKPTGFERQHNYGEVDMDGDVEIAQGDFGVAEMNTFFHRRPPN